MRLRSGQVRSRYHREALVPVPGGGLRRLSGCGSRFGRCSDGGYWQPQLAVRRLAVKHGLEMPICEQIHRVLFRRKSPLKAVTELMLRKPRGEIEEVR